MSDLINKHVGKTAHVIGNGPSAKDTIKNLVNKSRDEIVICCNDIDIHLSNIGLSIHDLKPDYWVLANPAMTVENSYHRINAMSSYGGCLLNGDSVLYSHSQDIVDISDQLLEIDFLGYDQRHFNGKTCPDIAPCCIKNMHKIMQGRQTIQEVLQSYTKHDCHYGGGSTVAVHMLAFAIVMGCSKIYLSGVDLDYKLGYFDNKKSMNNDSFDRCPDIAIDFSIIKDSARRIKVEILNLSPTSPLNDIL